MHTHSSGLSIHAHAPRSAALIVIAAAGLALGGCATGTTDSPSSTASQSQSSAPEQRSQETTADAPQEGQPVTNGPNSILSPGDGAVVDGPEVTITGDGTAFEATLLYEVVDEGGTSIISGFTTAGANGEVGPYEIDATLDPGTYTVRVWEPGMGETEGASEDELNLVEATFTVL